MSLTTLVASGKKKLPLPPAVEPLERAARSVVQGGVIGALTKGLLYMTFRGFGASPVASIIGSVGGGIILGKMAADLPPPDGTGGALDKIHLSLSVGESVLFPLAAGTIMAISRKDESSKKDAIVLLSTAALGAGVSLAVLSDRTG